MALLNICERILALFCEIFQISHSMAVHVVRHFAYYVPWLDLEITGKRELWLVKTTTVWNLCIWFCDTCLQGDPLMHSPKRCALQKVHVAEEKGTLVRFQFNTLHPLLTLFSLVLCVFQTCWAQGQEYFHPISCLPDNTTVSKGNIPPHHCWWRWKWCAKVYLCEWLQTCAGFPSPHSDTGSSMPKHTKCCHISSKMWWSPLRGGSLIIWRKKTRSWETARSHCCWGVEVIARSTWVWLPSS